MIAVQVILTTLAAFGALALLVGIAHFVVTGRRLWSPMPIGMKLGQIESRRQVLLHRMQHSQPSSSQYYSFQNALLRLEAKEDRLLLRELEDVPTTTRSAGPG